MQIGLKCSLNNEETEMTNPKARPAFVTDEHFAYLDILRESGTTNMFGAWINIEDEFGFDKRDAKIILSYWMDSYEDK